MRLKWNYGVISLITVVVAGVAGWLTQMGLPWYETLQSPVLTPPNWVFRVGWAIIYPLATVAAILVWNRFPHNNDFRWITGLFAANAVLNAAWSGLFFTLQMPGAALVNMVLLLGTLFALHAMTWQYSRTVSWLLVPYTVWVCFALYLNYGFWMLNPAT